MALTPTAPRVSQTENGFEKTFPNRRSYNRERRALGALQIDIAPRLLERDDATMTLRIEHAGKDLDWLLNGENQQFSVAQIRKVLGELLNGLKELHARGYCHYDVTPRNVCIAGDLASDYNVKLIDYGLSFRPDTIPETHRTQLVGTRSCLSPEHLACRPDLGEAADVFCTGITILQVIRGGLPVILPECGNLASQVRDAHTLIPTNTSWGEPLSSDLKIVLKSMLAVEPTYRRSKLCLSLLGSLE